MSEEHDARRQAAAEMAAKSTPEGGSLTGNTEPVALSIKKNSLERERLLRKEMNGMTVTTTKDLVGYREISLDERDIPDDYDKISIPAGTELTLRTDITPDERDQWGRGRSCEATTPDGDKLWVPISAFKDQVNPNIVEKHALLQALNIPQIMETFSRGLPILKLKAQSAELNPDGSVRITATSTSAFTKREQTIVITVAHQDVPTE